ncbi:hypothetical protein Ahy_A06g026555 [Arachis hypogaea]|uniref:Protein FAR1-RELATED SEQUENCE n=1 Tax=Arachis hypogaea TaxID=3818 RepID=A0A445CKX1_ARAHY|nr:hypothetical protein Ahy_A06g026555 [Arachis hypogaea]
MAKGKEKLYKDTIMQDDDAIVADLSDVEVDLGFLGSPGDGLMYDALDPGAESDGLQTELGWQVSWSKRLESIRTSSNGLISAVEEVMPQVHHRFCVWHLWRNFNKHWKDLELRRLLWDAARSTTFQDFIGNMDKIKRVSEEAWTYLNKWPRPKLLILGVHLQLKQATLPIRHLQQLTFHHQCLHRKLKRLNCPNQAMAPPPPTTRPPKLPTKWRNSSQPVTTSVDPMQGASAATSLRLARFMKFVPTPQFKAPRKKNL